MAACQVCRAILTSTDEERSPGACPYCGAKYDYGRKSHNPYADTDEWGFGLAPLDPIPSTLAGKLALSLRLFFGNLIPIAALFLTVWLPGNIATSIMAQGLDPSPTPEELLPILLMRALIEAAFGPIYTAGILYVLANQMTARPSSYGEGIRVGMHNWWRLFAARFVSTVFIFARLIPFIVPGVILSIRYSLIDAVVVLEGGGTLESKDRSAELVRGKELQILAGGTLIFAASFIVAMTLHAIAESNPEMGNLWMTTAFGCISDLFKMLGPCFLFTFYWEGQMQSPADLCAGLTSRNLTGLDEDH